MGGANLRRQPAHAIATRIGAPINLEGASPHPKLAELWIYSRRWREKM